MPKISNDQSIGLRVSNQAPLNDKYTLVIDLGPSVNDLHQNKKGSYKRILKSAGRKYIYLYSLEIKKWLRRHNHKQKTDFFYLDIYWYLPNRNCDSHNFEKALFDMLQKSGFVKNDKYIMNRTQEVSFDKKNPRVMIQWE